MQEKVMKQCTIQQENGQQKISQESLQKKYLNAIYGALGSHARTSLLQENKKDSLENEVESFTTSLTSSKAKIPKINPNGYSLKMLRTSCQLTRGGGFTEVLSEISEAGYDSEWTLLNSKNFGVPQNRERVFIIGHLRERGRREILPKSGTGKQVGEKGTGIETYLPSRHYQNLVYGIDGNARTITSADGGGIGNGVRTGLYAIPAYAENSPNQIIPGDQAHRVYDCEGVSVTVKAEGGGLGAKSGLYAVPKIKTIIKGEHQRQNVQEVSGIARTLTATEYKEPQPIAVPSTDPDSFGVMTYEGKEYNIRRLTPRECFRLQGFTDEQFDKAQAVNSNSQLYKQAGNAVTVNVAQYLGELLNEQY